MIHAPHHVGVTRSCSWAVPVPGLLHRDAGAGGEARDLVGHASEQQPLQISEAAARTYAQHGIQWSPGFLAGSTQEKLIEHFDDDFQVIDMLDAFLDPDARETSRQRIDVGEYFVYNKGDKLDWNHPNRDGHRLMADYLVRKGFLDRYRTDAPNPGASSTDTNGE